MKGHSGCRMKREVMAFSGIQAGVGSFLRRGSIRILRKVGMDSECTSVDSASA